MSTQFYGFRASGLGNLCEQIGIMKFLCATTLRSTVKDSREVQVFDTSEGLIFRVLEAGYGLKNLMWNNELFFSTAAYDDRTDIGQEFMCEKSLIDEIDNLILNSNYKVISLEPLSGGTDG